MSDPAALIVSVHDVEDAATDLKIYDLRRPGGEALPAFEPGAHIDVHLPDASRSYSILSDPGDLSRYLIAVALSPASRGGSRWIHSELRLGAALRISAPRNLFPLNEMAVRSVFVAGGIGITPIWTMVNRLEQRGLAWTLHYAVRSRAAAALLGEISDLRNRSVVGTVHLHIKNDPLSDILSIPSLFTNDDGVTHYYCCGPDRMLSELESAAAAAAIDAGRTHVERFGASVGTTPADAFVVRLARSDVEFFVPAEGNILDIVREAGIDVPFSCGQGVCGECEAVVLAGIPEHRDLVLSAAERAANASMMICCSRSLSDRLVLDL